MKLSTAEMKRLILESMEGDTVYSITDIKQYLTRKSGKEYTSGQLSGSLRQLTESGEIENVGRGLYEIGTGKAKQAESAERDRKEKVKEEFRVQIKQCLEETEQKMQKIVSEINVLEISSEDFEFLREIKYLNEQMKEIAVRC